ncbi:MAG: class I SAM-dependent methyltransferase [Candidatus Omnitrophica bacterium]|nr:class I SAM-dependent methyltransferase [Candidatus Omnitrophota bacterium]
MKKANKAKCQLCKNISVAQLLDLGEQPVTNRFLHGHGDSEYTYPMRVGQCEICAAVQLIDPVPAGELLPRFDWITYNEPEDHIEKLSEVISLLPGLNKDALISGVSFKDDSTLARLKARGFSRIYRLDAQNDLGIQETRAGAETIQARLTEQKAREIASKHGLQDLVIARHILEHAQEIPEFLQALKTLVKPQGFILLEVPDCSRALEKYDYTTLWEEHTVYFTPETFKNCFPYHGLSLLQFACYPYLFENVLTAILRPDEKLSQANFSLAGFDGEKNRMIKYCKGLPRKTLTFKELILKYRQDGKRIAVFGAGHLAAAFINLLSLGDCIDLVIDDNPHKQGLFMPGSRLPISGSGALLEQNVKLCLLGFSPEKEDKVIQKNQKFTEDGGIFASIFPASKYYLKNE